MIRKKPFLSVLMPTYNRAHLLPFAIKSVLEQTNPDLELIISNGGSTDNTRDVVAGFDDPRIRYIESKERLNIGDNYQQALDKAAGNYIIFLSDDDAFLPTMLERVTSIIKNEKAEILVFKSCFYFQDDAIFLERKVKKNSIMILPFDSKITKFSGDSAVRCVFANFHLGGKYNPRFNVSFLANAVYHQSVFSKLKSKRRKLFDTTPADGYLAAAVTFVVNSYHCLDEPLHVWTDHTDNATASADKKKNDLREHYEKLLNGKSLELTPLKYGLPLNCTFNALLTAIRDFEDDRHIEVDWSDYYFRMHQNMMYLKSIGISVTDELDEWRNALASEPETMRKLVEWRISSPAYKVKYFIYNSSPRLYRLIKRAATFKTSASGETFYGSDNAFDNVLECARFVANKIRN